MPEASLLQRLKERKLVQRALAYLAGAFVVFQGVEVMAEPWGISPALQRAGHIALVIGFFITLVLAWYHGEKGRQRVSGPELLMVAALLVVAGVALNLVGHDRASDAARESRRERQPLLPGSEGAEALPEDYVVVFPFRTLTGDPELDPLVSYAAYSIADGLSRVPEVRNVSQSFVEQTLASMGPGGAPTMRSFA